VQEISMDTLEAIKDDECGASYLNGTLFEDHELGWCRITGWGVKCGIIVIFYSPMSGDDTPREEEVTSLAGLLCWIRQSPSPPLVPKFESSRMLQ
jgi:hypothetical protein